MGTPRHDQSVLLASRFSFSAVDDNHRPAAGSLRDRAPLGGNGKPSAAPTDQPRLLDRIDETAPNLRQRTEPFRCVE